MLVKAKQEELNEQILKFIVQILEINSNKSEEYKWEESIYSTFELAEKLNFLSVEKVLFVRWIWDKLSRISNLHKKWYENWNVKWETIFDTVSDLINYAALLDDYLAVKEWKQELEEYVNFFNEVENIFNKKNWDYSTNDNAFSNFNEIELYWLWKPEDWILSRVAIKVQRIANFLKKWTEHARVHEELVDLVVYSLLFMWYLYFKNNTEENKVEIKEEVKEESKEEVKENVEEVKETKEEEQKEIVEDKKENIEQIEEPKEKSVVETVIEEVIEENIVENNDELLNNTSTLPFEVVNENAEDNKEEQVEQTEQVEETKEEELKEEVKEKKERKPRKKKEEVEVDLSEIEWIDFDNIINDDNIEEIWKELSEKMNEEKEHKEKIKNIQEQIDVQNEVEEEVDLEEQTVDLWSLWDLDINDII